MNEIAESLRLCVTVGEGCTGCIYECEEDCDSKLHNLAADELERLTAEVERLQKYEDMIKNLDSYKFERLSKLMVIVEQFKNDVTALI
jgi:hypothetical protein